MAEGNDIVKWADQAMFEAAPMKRDDLGRIVPQAFLLSATPDPLGAIAAASRMYKGIPTYSLDEITDEEREQYWRDSIDGHLKAPWEFVDLHFMIEAVTRSFTHQIVRQRTAVFTQESLRFAVKEGLAQETPLPPSIADGTELASIWWSTMRNIEDTYNGLINAGVPAEDARGILPHATTTRLNYKTNLRGLLEHAGNRLCTQAQFEWRAVFFAIMRAIQTYDSGRTYMAKTEPLMFRPLGSSSEVEVSNSTAREVDWQWELIGAFHPSTFAPVCYKLGHCPFQASYDRQCTIRSRVQAFAEAGVASGAWHYDHERSNSGFGPGVDLNRIIPEEWAADPTAGRRD